MVAQTATPSPQLGADYNLYVKAALNGQVKTSKLKPGDVVEGVLAQPVFSGSREFLPAGSKLRATVDKLERRKRPRNNHWPWVIQAFMPRHENYPTFQSATVTLPDGKEVPLNVSLISIGRRTSAHAMKPTGDPSIPTGPGKSKTKPPLIMTLQANSTAVAGSTESSAPAASGPVTLATGTGAKIILMNGVSASKSSAGDTVHARLVEPVRIGSTVVLPEGTVFEGKVVKSKKPKWLSRSGSLLLNFTNVMLPNSANLNPVVASITEAEVDPASHTKIDPEGQLKGSTGKAWMLINIGVTAGIAKVADDGLQLLIEAVSSTATDASTAGTGRIIAICAGGIFMITRHGRDVILPQFSEMSIMLDRPLSLELPK
jgi:hypothetical protein